LLYFISLYMGMLYVYDCFTCTKASFVLGVSNNYVSFYDFGDHQCIFVRFAHIVHLKNPGNVIGCCLIALKMTNEWEITVMGHT
jgi:hypothetical protein